MTVEQLNGARAFRSQLIDVCSPAEFAAGHIAGAVNLPLEQVEETLAGAACRGGRGVDRSLSDGDWVGKDALEPSAQRDETMPGWTLNILRESTKTPSTARCCVSAAIAKTLRTL